MVHSYSGMLFGNKRNELVTQATRMSVQALFEVQEASHERTCVIPRVGDVQREASGGQEADQRLSRARGRRRGIVRAFDVVRVSF